MIHFFDRYVYESTIGNGSFGKVYSARRKIDNMQVAIKRVKIRSSMEFYLDKEEEIPFEIYVLKRLYHIPGVVKMLDYFVGTKSYHIVMEYAWPDLFECMRMYKYFNEDLCKRLFKDILETIILCKDCGFIHNDIKLENVALDPPNSTIKILDFGLADFYKSGYTTIFKGTFKFASPEWKEFKIHDTEMSTVWTLGLLLYEISQGCFPVFNRNFSLSFVIQVSPMMQDFMKQCLSYYHRPSLNELQDHEWLKE